MPITLVNGIAEGTTLEPRTSQTWIGAPGAIISGLYTIPNTNWTSLGAGRWSTTVPTMSNIVPFVGSSGTRGAYNQQGSGHRNSVAVYREVIYINKLPMYRRANAADVAGLNEYHYDYTTQVLTIGCDPAGRTIEHNVPLKKGAAASTSYFGRVIDTGNNGITLRNLTFEGGMPDNGHGVVVCNNPSVNVAWIIEDCLFRCSNYNLMTFYGSESVTHNHIIRRCLFQTPGGNAVGSNYSHGAQMQDSLVIGCNQSGFAQGWDRAGMKWVRSDDVKVTYTEVRECDSLGIWYDIECRRPEVNNCALEANRTHGIDQEIGFGGDGLGAKSATGGFHHNKIRYNGGHGVYLNTSREHRVFSNLFKDNGGGYESDYRSDQTVQDYDRSYPTADGDDASGPPRTGSPGRHGINNDWYDNIIIKSRMPTQTVASLLLRYYTHAGPHPDSLTTNAYANNKYELATTSWNMGRWDGTLQTFAQWQAAGRDANSTLVSYTDPDLASGGIRNSPNGFTTAGDAVTSANSGGTSGTPFSFVYTGGATPSTATVMDRRPASKGSKWSYRLMQRVSGDGTGSAYLEWQSTALGGAFTTGYGGMDVYFPMNPGPTISLLDMRTDTSGTQVRSWRLDWLSTGKLGIIGPGGTTMASSNLSLPQARWFGVDWSYVAGASGSVTVRIYLNPYSSIPDDQFVFNGNVGTDVNRVRFGNIIGSVASEMLLTNLSAKRTNWQLRDS